MHYPLAATRKIPSIIRSSGLFVPAPNAHLWNWVTDNFLEDGLFVMRDLGFHYVRTMVWVKMPDPFAVLSDLIRSVVAGGTPELVVVQLMGHSSSAMVRRVYARTGSDAQSDAAARFPALRKPAARKSAAKKATSWARRKA